MGHVRTFVTELLATFVLVLGGCGAAAVNVTTGGSVTPLGVSLAFGLAVTVMVYTVGHISGAHMNPAVSLALALTRRFPPVQLITYLCAQVAGATLAGVLLDVLLPRAAAAAALTLPRGTAPHAFLTEAVMTAVLMFVIMGVATDTRAVGQAAAVAIGGVVVMADLVAGPISGGSLNPARSLGPAIADNTYTSIWIYLTAPVLGAVVGAFAYQFIRGDTPQEPPASRDDGRVRSLLPAPDARRAAAAMWSAGSSQGWSMGRHVRISDTLIGERMESSW